MNTYEVWVLNHKSKLVRLMDKRFSSREAYAMVDSLHTSLNATVVRVTS